MMILVCIGFGETMRHDLLKESCNHVAREKVYLVYVVQSLALSLLCAFAATTSVDSCAHSYYIAMRINCTGIII